MSESSEKLYPDDPAKIKIRRELDALRLLIVAIVVIGAVAAAILVVVSPVGVADSTPELRTTSMSLLRDIVLLGMGALVGTSRNTAKPTTED